EDAPLTTTRRASQNLGFSDRARREVGRKEMLQHILTQHFFWFVAQHLLYCRAQISEAALSIGGKDDLRHVLHQLAILEFRVTQCLDRLFLPALGKQDSRAGAEQ